MNVETYLRNKIVRQIKWNGQNFVFVRYVPDDYHQLKSEIETTFDIKGLFHEGGGYGGMLNIELFERDGGRTVSKMKPMILCLYEDGKCLAMDDFVTVGDNLYKIVDKIDIKNLRIAYEISLEIVNVVNGT